MLAAGVVPREHHFGGRVRGIEIDPGKHLVTDADVERGGGVVEEMTVLTGGEGGGVRGVAGGRGGRGREPGPCIAAKSAGGAAGGDGAIDPRDDGAVGIEGIQRNEAATVGQGDFGLDPLLAVVLGRDGVGRTEGGLLVAGFPDDARAGEIEAGGLHGEGDGRVEQGDARGGGDLRGAGFPRLRLCGGAGGEDGEGEEAARLIYADVFGGDVERIGPAVVEFVGRGHGSVGGENEFAKFGAIGAEIVESGLDVTEGNAVGREDAAVIERVLAHGLALAFLAEAGEVGDVDGIRAALVVHVSRERVEVGGLRRDLVGDGHIGGLV